MKTLFAAAVLVAVMTACGVGMDESRQATQEEIAQAEESGTLQQYITTVQKPYYCAYGMPPATKCPTAHGCWTVMGYQLITCCLCGTATDAGF